MKICLITAFPPSRRGLNEYGFHLARELRRDPLLSLTVLADELDAPVEELPEFDVIRCWRFDALSNPLRLTKVIRDINPDVVWFIGLVPDSGPAGAGWVRCYSRARTRGRRYGCACPGNR